MYRLRSLVVATLIVPCALAAQQPAQPSANPITDSFKAFHTRYGNWLKTAFDSIPSAKYSFKPTPAQQTVGYVAQHLEGANYGLCAAFTGTRRTMTARDSLADTVKAQWPKDTLTARLKASFDFCDAALAKVTDASLSEMIASPFGRPGTMVPRARLVLVYVADLVDHWSQIANYMRLNGLVPPSAYPRPGM